MGMIKIARMLTTLIIGLIAGPAVSLYGSPTVSPVTAAACAKEPLPPRFPSSINFFALSHAAPPDVIAMAMNNPVTMVPTNRPPSTTAPSEGMLATTMTATNGNNAGCLAHRVHTKGGKDEWQKSTYEKADDHFRITERELKRKHLAPTCDVAAQFFHV